jgi:hypothetical protein
LKFELRKPVREQPAFLFTHSHPRGCECQASPRDSAMRAGAAGNLSPLTITTRDVRRSRPGKTHQPGNSCLIANAIFRKQT